MTWQIHYGAKPMTINSAYRLHHLVVAANTKEWRQAFAWLARAQHIPPLERIVVAAQATQHFGQLADLMAYAPAIKAAIDGLVDAGVIVDDDQEHLVSLVLRPTRRGPDGLTLTICKATDEDPGPITVGPTMKRHKPPQEAA